MRDISRIARSVSKICKSMCYIYIMLLDLVAVEAFIQRRIQEGNQEQQQREPLHQVKPTW